MNVRMTKAQHAARLAAAIKSTTARYKLGQITYGTWKTHVEGLVWQAKRHDLEDDVRKLVVETERKFKLVKGSSR